MPALVEVGAKHVVLLQEVRVTDLKKMRAKSNARLGTRMRGQLADAYDARGHNASDLVFVYSPKADRDFVLRSEVEFGHFLLVESDPDVQKVDYSPSKRVATLAGEGIGTIVDAEVTLGNGSVVWREVKSSQDVGQGAQNRANLQLMIQLRAAESVAARHELFTEKEIYAQPQRIHNWLRIVPWLAQVREWPLLEYGNEVAALLRARGTVVLRDVLEMGQSPAPALYGAALFKAVQYGLIGSQLDVLPMTQNSRFFALESLR